MSRSTHTSHHLHFQTKNIPSSFQAKKDILEKLDKKLKEEARLNKNKGDGGSIRVLRNWLSLQQHHTSAFDTDDNDEDKDKTRTSPLKDVKKSHSPINKGILSDVGRKEPKKRKKITSVRRKSKRKDSGRRWLQFLRGLYDRNERRRKPFDRRIFDTGRKRKKRRRRRHGDKKLNGLARFETTRKLPEVEEDEDDILYYILV